MLPLPLHGRAGRQIDRQTDRHAVLACLGAKRKRNSETLTGYGNTVRWVRRYNLTVANARARGARRKALDVHIRILSVL